MSAGWHPDPTGRFGARFFDGTDWTDQVQGADGRPTTDALERSSGLAAPTSVPDASSPAPAMAPPAAGPAPAPGWTAAPAGPAPMAKATGLVGVAIAGFGWLLAAISLLVLDWADGATRGDLADALPDPLPDGLELADSISIAYIQWMGFVLLALVLLGIGVVLLGLLGRDPTALRLVVGALVALAAVVHAFAVVRGLRDAIEIGAHVGTLGYLVVLVGLAIGSRSRRLT